MFNGELRNIVLIKYFKRHSLLQFVVFLKKSHRCKSYNTYNRCNLLFSDI